MTIYMSSLKPDGTPHQIDQITTRKAKYVRRRKKKSQNEIILSLLTESKTIDEITEESKIMKSSVRRVLTALYREGKVVRLGDMMNRRYVMKLD